jgi:hypothetical protein
VFGVVVVAAVLINIHNNILVENKGILTRTTTQKIPNRER